MESKTKLKARAAAIAQELARTYPDAECALRFANPFELLAATILSAQCTDERVNMVTPALFARFPTPKAMAAASLEELEELVRTTGFFRNKAKNLKGMAAGIMERFGGEVPRTMEELASLPGVGRKTANVVLGNCFETPGLTVDTHMQRVTSRRLCIVKSEDPEKIERELMELIPQPDWTRFSHQVISHGRQVCTARKPMCEICPLTQWCVYFAKFREPAAAPKSGTGRAGRTRRSA